MRQGSSDHIGGYLYGEVFVDNPAGEATPIQVMLSEDGRLRALQMFPYNSPQSRLLLAGNFTIDGFAIRGTGRAFADEGAAWIDGSTVSGLEFAGTVERPTGTSDGRLLLTWTTAAGDSGRLDAEFAQMSGYYGPLKTDGLRGSWLARPFASAARRRRVDHRTGRHDPGAGQRRLSGHRAVAAH